MGYIVPLLLEYEEWDMILWLREIGSRMQVVTKGMVEERALCRDRTVVTVTRLVMHWVDAYEREPPVRRIGRYIHIHKC